MLGLWSWGKCRRRNMCEAWWKDVVNNTHMCRYGTPFLLSLGISEQVTSLVWLAGPISGLIAQPLIGALIPFFCVDVASR